VVQKLRLGLLVLVGGDLALIAELGQLPELLGGRSRRRGATGIP
jgi:hypothetical protein